MKRRFTIENGLLIDRDGVCLGEITALTLDDSKANVDLVRYSAAAADPGATGLSFFSGSRNGSTDEQSALEMGAAEEPHKPAEPPVDPIREVWEHYVAVMEPRSPALGQQERTIIRDALKVATVEECKRAIDGCRASDFHMGRNEKRRSYNRLSHILKGKRGGKTTREQIDFFLDIAEKSGLPSGVPSASNEKVRRAKRAVLDAAEFPGDQQVVQRGEAAVVFLESAGWQVDRSGETPRFVEPGQAAA